MNAELDTHARRAASAVHLSADGIDPVGRLHDLRRAQRRRSRAQVAAAFTLLVALVAAGVLARRYDPPAGAPLPSRVTIPVGRQPTTVAVGEGAVWVANQVGNSVTRIDPRTNRVVATIATGGRQQVAADSQTVWRLPLS